MLYHTGAWEKLVLYVTSVPTGKHKECMSQKSDSDFFSEIRPRERIRKEVSGSLPGKEISVTRETVRHSQNNSVQRSTNGLSSGVFLFL
jgi:hypothetical protein